VVVDAEEVAAVLAEEEVVLLVEEEAVLPAAEVDLAVEEVASVVEEADLVEVGAEAVDAEEDVAGSKAGTRARTSAFSFIIHYTSALSYSVT
jgi:hypothetical protein